MGNKIVNAVVYRNDDKLYLLDLITEKVGPCSVPNLMHILEGSPMSETSIALVNLNSDKITVYALTNLYDMDDNKLTAKKIKLDDLIDIAYRAAMDYKKMPLGS